MSEHERGSAAGWLGALVVLVAVVVLLATLDGGHGSEPRADSVDINGLRPPPPASDFGTRREIGTRGDDGNPRALFHGAFPSDAETQERRIGGRPARFSGYTTWVRSVTTVPAREFVDGYSGRYLRAHVQVFNRDAEAQDVCGCDFFVWTRAGGLREADVVTGQTVSPEGQMPSGARREGDVYLYVGNVRGPYFILFDPDNSMRAETGARGVWRARF